MRGSRYPRVDCPLRSPARPVRSGRAVQGRAGLVEVALRDQRARTRVAGTVGKRHRLVPAGGAASLCARDHRARPTGVHLRGRLPDRSEAQDVVREPGRHRHGRVDDPTELAGKLGATRVPTGCQPEQADDVGDTRPGHPWRAVPCTRIRRDPVDVVRRQPGVGDGGERGLAGQEQWVPPEPTPDPRDADAADRGVVLEVLAHAGVTGRNSGRKISPCFAKHTSTSRSHRRSDRSSRPDWSGRGGRAVRRARRSRRRTAGRIPGPTDSD